MDKKRWQILYLYTSCSFRVDSDHTYQCTTFFGLGSVVSRALALKQIVVREATVNRNNYKAVSTVVF